MLKTTYRCSLEADLNWRRLCRIYALGGDGVHGQNWAERALGKQAHMEVSDLGTDERLTYIACQSALVMLSKSGSATERLVSKLARRRLTGHGVREMERKHGIDAERGKELFEGAKELLWYFTSPDPVGPPELPW